MEKESGLRSIFTIFQRVSARPCLPERSPQASNGCSAKQWLTISCHTRLLIGRAFSNLLALTAPSPAATACGSSVRGGVDDTSTGGVWVLRRSWSDWPVHLWIGLLISDWIHLTLVVQPANFIWCHGNPLLSLDLYYVVFFILFRGNGCCTFA